jgi:hypothetical protein
MQRGEHQTEFANNKVDKSSYADEQQPRGTSELHGPNRLKLSDFAPGNKADQCIDSREVCGTVAPIYALTDSDRKTLATSAALTPQRTRLLSKLEYRNSKKRVRN